MSVTIQGVAPRPNDGATGNSGADFQSALIGVAGPRNQHKRQPLTHSDL